MTVSTLTHAPCVPFENETGGIPRAMLLWAVHVVGGVGGVDLGGEMTRDTSLPPLVRRPGPLRVWPTYLRALLGQACCEAAARRPSGRRQAITVMEFGCCLWWWWCSSTSYCRHKDRGISQSRKFKTREVTTNCVPESLRGIFICCCVWCLQGVVGGGEDVLTPSEQQ